MQCLRCNHQWRARGDERPVECPRCKSAHWDRPRIRNRRCLLISEAQWQQAARIGQAQSVPQGADAVLHWVLATYLAAEAEEYELERRANARKGE